MSGTAPTAPARTTPVRRLHHPAPVAIASVVAAIVAVPVVSLAAIALAGTGEDWPHLLRNVLPGSALTTLYLLALVGVGTASIGVVSAWLVVTFDFPLRRALAWALVLPLAVPTYLAAYAFGEFFHYSGPVQSALRAAFGLATARDYWFPDIRSTGGAGVVLSAVLYPYVYLTTRLVFLMQGRNVGDVARTLGAGPGTVFVRVLVPVARPAILAGLALVMMETINDIGAAEYLGVRTLTFSVYSTWLNRGSLEGAAQIALVMLALIAGLIALERWARRRQRFHLVRATQIRARPSRIVLGGWRAVLASLAVLLPVLAGFGIPLVVFCRYAARRLPDALDAALLDAFLNTLLTAALTAAITVGAALAVLYALRVSRRPATFAIARLASVGYALPGTVLGIGLLFALARFDNAVSGAAQTAFGVSTGLLVSGSFLAVVIACAIRFVSLAEGAITSGLEKLPPHLDEAAQNLGRTPFQSASTILAPLLWPAILSAAVLVFVDTAKELSATILLRPFGFNTLATFVYENASRGVVEDGALAALLIVATSLAPVALLTRALMRDLDA